MLANANMAIDTKRRAWRLLQVQDDGVSGFAPHGFAGRTGGLSVWSKVQTVGLKRSESSTPHSALRCPTGDIFGVDSSRATFARPRMHQNRVRALAGSLPPESDNPQGGAVTFGDNQ